MISRYSSEIFTSIIKKNSIYTVLPVQFDIAFYLFLL